MSYLKKELALFERKEGKIIPQNVKLLGSDDEIQIIPLTRGEIKELFSQTKEGNTTAEQDKKIILEHLTEPKYTAEDIDFMKAGYATIIVSTILVNSGIKIDGEKRTESDEIKKS